MSRPTSPDDPLLAVVAPPHVARLRELAAIGDDAEMSVDFTGWSKRVVLVDDRALLFPRDHHNVDALHREVAALRAVAPAGLAEVPLLHEVWDDPTLSPYPVAVVGRRPGHSLDRVLDEVSVDDLAHVLEQVAAMAARWHAVDPGEVATASGPDRGQRSAIDLMLGSDDATEVAEAVAAELDAPSIAMDLADALRLARSLDPVLLHGDLHEAQILIDDDFNVTGILDWQTAHVGNPYLEFNFDEWGTTVWRLHRRELRGLRRRQWAAYAEARGLPPDHAKAFDAFWAADHAVFTSRAARAGTLRPHISGTAEEALAVLLDAVAQWDVDRPSPRG